MASPANLCYSVIKFLIKGYRCLFPLLASFNKTLLYSIKTVIKFDLAQCAPLPLGERNCSVAAPASMKKYAAHFFISDCIGTEPAEAPPQLLVNLLEWQFND